MRTLKLGIAGVDPACPNKGVEALAYSALYLLRELECELDCRFDLFLICDNRKLEQCTLEIGNCRCQLIRLAPLNFRYWKNAAKTLLFYLRHPDRLGCWLQLDAVLDAGLGDSFSDLYGMRRFREINDPKWWLRLLRIPELMLPQTVGPFQSPRAIRAATRSLRAERAPLCKSRGAQTKLRPAAFYRAYKKPSRRAGGEYSRHESAQRCWARNFVTAVTNSFFLARLTGSHCPATCTLSFSMVCT